MNAGQIRLAGACKPRSRAGKNSICPATFPPSGTMPLAVGLWPQPPARPPRLRSVQSALRSPRRLAAGLQASNHLQGTPAGQPRPVDGAATARPVTRTAASPPTWPFPRRSSISPSPLTVISPATARWRHQPDKREQHKAGQDRQPPLQGAGNTSESRAQYETGPQQIGANAAANPWP